MNTILKGNLGTAPFWLSGAIGLALLGAWSCSTPSRDFGNRPSGTGGGDGGGAAGDGGGDAGPSLGGTPSGGDAGATSADTGGQNGQGGETNVEVDPESCSQDDDCVVSGSCRISYRDRDGDGYGNDDDTTGRCDGSIPAGYASIGGDCCDDGGNLDVAALINPGQTTYFDSPALICGIAWDYNCNGTVETSPSSLSRGCLNEGDPPPCYPNNVPTTIDDCGETRTTGTACVSAGQPTHTCMGMGVAPVTVRCH